MKRILLLLLVSGTAVGDVCQNLTWEQFKAEAARRDWQRVVFFASWCSSCRARLAEAHASHVAVIAIFDEAAAASKVTRSLHLAECWQGDALAEHFGIRHLPASLMRVQSTWLLDP